MKSPVVAFIFARGGSKGVPRKNVRDFAGKPLIAHAIEVARASRLIDRVIVSTEDEEIARVSRKHGAEVPFMRPVELAADKSPELLSWKHAITTLGDLGCAPGTFVSVPAPSPLRSVEDVEACINRLETPETDLVVTVTPSRRHPMYNLVVLDEGGLVRVATAPPKVVYQRQEMPSIFEIAGVAYAAHPSFIMGADSVLGGRTRSVTVPEERAIDIDTELDFAIAEFLFKRRNSVGNQ